MTAVADGHDDDAVLERTIDFLRPEPGSVEGELLGGPMVGLEGSLFGGHVVSHAVAAAMHGRPTGTRLHSFHGYFLRPLSATEPIRSTTTPIKQGRSFTSHRIELSQGDKPAFTMTCSFTADTEGGYDYDVGAHDLPDRAALEIASDDGPWLHAWVGPSPVRADGTRTSTSRKWVKTALDLPDDASLHAALLAFVTDWTDTGGRPLHLDGSAQGMISLDHAAWFHRPARADAWHFWDVTSTVNAGGRGFVRGSLYDEAGRTIATMAQEMLLTVIERPT